MTSPSRVFSKSPVVTLYFILKPTSELGVGYLWKKKQRLKTSQAFEIEVLSKSFYENNSLHQARPASLLPAGVRAETVVES